MSVVKGRAVVEMARQVGQTARRVIDTESFALLARECTRLPRPHHFLAQLARRVRANFFHFSESRAIVVVDDQLELAEPPVGRLADDGAGDVERVRLERVLGR